MVVRRKFYLGPTSVLENATSDIYCCLTILLLSNRTHKCLLLTSKNKIRHVRDSLKLVLKNGETFSVTGTGPFIDTDNDTGSIVCVLIKSFF